MAKTPEGREPAVDMRAEFRAMRGKLDARQALAKQLTEIWSKARGADSLPPLLREMEEAVVAHEASLRKLPATAPVEQLVNGLVVLALDGRDEEFMKVLSDHLEEEHPVDIVEVMKRSGVAETDVGDGKEGRRKGFFGWVAPGSELERYMNNPPVPAPPGFNIGSELWGGGGAESGLCRRIAAATGLEFQAERFSPAVQVEPSVVAGDEQSESPTPKPLDAPWRAHRAGGMPLRGWDEIVRALGRANDRSLRGIIKRVNEETGGPISYDGDKPEADRGELVAWIENTDARNDARQKAQRNKDSTQDDLGDRSHSDLAKLKMQVEKRPNARGKAK